MGWASGSELLDSVARIVMPRVKKAERIAVAEKLIEAFEEMDCDTICEVEQEDVRKAYDAKYPPEDEE